MGSSYHSKEEREENDYYATPPEAVEHLLKLEKFSPSIWEPACGEGHISKVLEAHGYSVLSTDKIDRGYGLSPCDFLETTDVDSLDMDIITNPPYRYAREFVERALAEVTEGHKVAMFLRLLFLEGKSRREFFKNTPPRTVYVSSSRLQCGKNGVFAGANATCYCWMVWEKGYKGDTVIKWFN